MDCIADFEKLELNVPRIVGTFKKRVCPNEQWNSSKAIGAELNL